jgi:hypothetical protein
MVVFLATWATQFCLCPRWDMGLAVLLMLHLFELRGELGFAD